ncbi:hypothetical protein [Alteromonas gracilis]|uniref:hypothetical protein n=1 Tax=Alteromonas gracilis TaxID=1479524 RepID=UPI003736A873
MNTATFQTFDTFLRPIYDSKVEKYITFMEVPPSFEKFKQDYLDTNGFKAWLESMHGLNATDKQIYSILTMYMKHAKKTVSEVPQLLAWLDRYHDITLPLIEGIATAEYWQKRLSDKAH